MEKSMKTLSRLAASLVLTAAFAAPALADPAYSIAAPATNENLSVYFVRGNGTGGTAPLTFDEAIRNGQAKVSWNDGGNPLTVENFSDRAIFIPFGTLLVGGMQDQVSNVSLLVPPHSGPIALASFCVDPFRSTKRDREDASTLAPADTLFPNRIAKLAMLADAPGAKSASNNIRQASVWWAIESTRSALSHALGVNVEPPYQPHWETSPYQEIISTRVLADREFPWTTSLPLALQNTTLRMAEQTYVDALGGSAPADDDVIGAVFTIKGVIEDAEIYDSHALFAAMWPKLLRTHAVSALAATGEPAQPAPSIEAVSAFLADAEAGAVRERAAGATIRDSAAAIYTETRARSGKWLSRSFVATAISASAAASPEATLLAMLKTGMVAGKPITAMGDRDQIVLHRSDASWTATLLRPADFLQQLRAAFPAGGHGTPQGSGSSLFGAIVTLSFFAMLFRMLVPQRRARRRVHVVRTGFGSARLAAPDPVADRYAHVTWRIAAAPAPRLEPVRRGLVSMKAFTAALAALFWRALMTARGLAAALAGRLGAARASWPLEGLVSALAHNLGPAWPGNFGGRSRHATVRRPR